MKKIFGALMIAVCIGMAMPAQAQIHFGVKGGLNLSKASFSNVGDNFKKDNFTGFFIGPMAEFNIPIVGLGVDAALLFAQRGIKVSFCVVMFGLINVNILYYSFSTLYQMCNLRQSL